MESPKAPHPRNTDAPHELRRVSHFTRAVYEHHTLSCSSPFLHLKRWKMWWWVLYASVYCLLYFLTSLLSCILRSVGLMEVDLRKQASSIEVGPYLLTRLLLPVFATRASPRHISTPSTSMRQYSPEARYINGTFASLHWLMSGAVSKFAVWPTLPGAISVHGVDSVLFCLHISEDSTVGYVE